MIFLTKGDLLVLHDRVLELDGGEPGLLSEASLESALLAPQNRHHYENAGLARYAATYAFHLTRAHAFVDGNKRVGTVAMEVFLGANGARLDATDEAIEALILAVAAGNTTRNQVDAWMEERVRV